AFAVADDFFGEFEADVIERGLERSELRAARGELGVAGHAIGENEDGVVGAHVAIDRDAIKTMGDGFGERGLKRGPFDGGVGGDEAKHGGVQSLRDGGGTSAGGGHAGLDHAGAFANAANADGFSAELEFDRDFLGFGVAGHDGFDGMLRGLHRIIQQRGGGGDAAFDIGHGQRDADAAGGGHENVLGGEVKNFRGGFGHGEGVAQALGAGAG